MVCVDYFCTAKNGYVMVRLYQILFIIGFFGMTSIAVAQHEGHTAEPVAHDQTTPDQAVHVDTNVHAAHDSAHAEEGFKIP